MSKIQHTTQSDSIVQKPYFTYKRSIEHNKMRIVKKKDINLVVEGGIIKVIINPSLQELVYKNTLYNEQSK